MEKEFNPKERFKKRVYDYANKMGVEINSLAFRSMKNKWASYSTNNNINFNIKLLSADQQVGDYVIVHELLHFKVPNHSKLWKSLMRAYLGDYEKLEEQLKTLV